MPSPAEVILNSLGLQARLGAEIAQTKGNRDRRELDALRDIGTSFQSATTKIAKKIEDDEIASLESLFAAQVASGKAGSFGEASMRVDLRSAAAQRARVQLIGQARQLTRQDEQDDRSEALFGVQMAEAERQAQLFPGQLENQELSRRSLEEGLEDAAAARAARTAREARDAEYHNARMEAMAVSRRASEIELGQSEKGRAVIGILDLTRPRVDKTLDRVLEYGLEDAPEVDTRLAAFDKLDEFGSLDRFFPRDDPLAAYAKKQYRQELLAGHMAEMEVKATEAKFRNEILQSQIGEVTSRHGGDAWSAGRTAAVKAIKNVDFQDPGSFVAAYDFAIAEFDRQFLNPRFVEDGLSRSTLREIGIQSIGEQMESRLLQSMVKRSSMSPQVLSSLMARQEAWVDARMAESNIGLSLDPDDPVTEQTREKFRKEYRLAMAKLGLGRLSPEQMGLDACTDRHRRC